MNASPQLQPQSIGGLLETSWRTYFRRLGPLLTVSAAVVVPATVFGIALQAAAYPELFEGVAVNPFGAGQSDPIPTDRAGMLFLASVVAALVQGLAALVLFGAGFKMTRDAYLGHDSEWRQGLHFATTRLFGLVVVSVLVLLLGMIAFAALVIPGVWLAVSWAVAIPARLQEDARGVDALRRSFRLVRGRWWPTFGFLLLAGLLIGIAGTIVSLLIGAIGSAAGSGIGVGVTFAALSNAASALLTMPAYAVLAAVLYFDLRTRKEGLSVTDLEGRQPPSPSPAPAPPPPPPA